MPKAATAITGSDDALEEGPRPLRADAQRNRARVLEAAETVFAAEGISVPVDIIAEKAGVGIGTLYRHFPTKEKLFEAILTGRIMEIADDARARLDSADAGMAFFEFLEHLVKEGASKRDLIQALLGADVDEVAVAECKRNLEAAAGELLEVAQRAGVVRSDVTAAVVLSLVGATCMAADRPHTAEVSGEFLTIIRNGLRPPHNPSAEKESAN